MKTKDLTLTAMFAALIAACSWISVPGVVPFTLQTLGVFLAVGLLGGKRGTLAVVVYILLGAVGLPVFAGFRGGVGVLFGATGGYIMGFSALAALMWLLQCRLGDGKAALLFSMCVGLLLCYAFGTAWFMLVYARAGDPIGLSRALAWCVLPYVLPDALKLSLAFTLCLRLKKLSLFHR